jgi:hypothetical protein
MLAFIGWAKRYNPQTNVSSAFAAQIPVEFFGVRDEMLATMEQSRSELATQIGHRAK